MVAIFQQIVLQTETGRFGLSVKDGHSGLLPVRLDTSWANICASDHSKTLRSCATDLRLIILQRRPFNQLHNTNMAADGGKEHCCQIDCWSFVFSSGAHNHSC